MPNAKLFTAIYIPNTPFEDEHLKQDAGKINFKLEESERLADTLYRFTYSKNEGKIICFYIVNDWEGPYRYLFVENNELYDEFTSQFGVTGVQGGYWEWGMDTYLDNYSPAIVFEKLNKAINSGYDEDTPMPKCHIYGQGMWHESAFIVANRTALEEMRNAIDIALKYGEMRTNLSPSDDEGYDLFISCVEDEFNWDLIDMPYHDPVSFEKPKVPVKAFRKYKLDE